jgi:prepilin-type N-terminal cleavage/methylation domain-containing protein
MHKKHGFTLIEILLCLSIFGVAMLGLLRLDVQSQKLLREASTNQTLLFKAISEHEH